MKRIVIAIDAGHGGPDPGAVHNGLREADLTEELAARLSSFVRLAGHRAELVRPTQWPAPLSARPQRAIELGAHLFVSIHINAFRTTARGFQVWHHGPDQRSRTIAARMHRMVTDALPDWAGNASRVGADTELYRSGLGVLRGAHQRMPALLLEVGFIDNADDAALLRDPVLKQTTMLQVMAALAASLAHSEL